MKESRAHEFLLSKLHVVRSLRDRIRVSERRVHVGQRDKQPNAFQRRLNLQELCRLEIGLDAETATCYNSTGVMPTTTLRL